MRAAASHSWRRLTLRDRQPPGATLASLLEDFFAGLPFKSTLEVGNPTLHLHNWAYSLFVQDDWRATRKLTVNFGLRYEFSSVPQEDHNLLGNFDPNTGLVQVNTGSNSIPSLYNPDHKNFAPRIWFRLGHDAVTGNGDPRRTGPGLRDRELAVVHRLQQRFGPGSVPTGASSMRSAIRRRHDSRR